MTELVESSAYLSPPVERAARLLRHIAEGDAVRNMSATSRALGINRTTLLRLLQTLENERFIEPRPDGSGWRIGLGLIGLASKAFFSEDLVQLAVPVATRLADGLGLSAHLGVLDGLDVIYVVRRTPNHSYVSNIRVGSRLPAHASVMGRAMLAFLQPERVCRMYEGAPMAPSTAHTAVTVGQLLARLAEDRVTGLAWSDGFFEPGITSVAAPVFDATAMPVAALNVSGPESAFTGAGRRERIAAAVREAAEDISRRLGWHGASLAAPSRLERVA